MKYLLCLCLLAASLSGHAQTSPAPFKGANVLIIHTTDSAAVAYRKFAGILLAAGYGIKSADKDLLSLTTDPRPLRSPGATHHPRAFVGADGKGAVIRLRDAFTVSAAYSFSVLPPAEADATYRGMPGSAFMVCWQELERLAALYPSTTVTYGKD